MGAGANFQIFGSEPAPLSFSQESIGDDINVSLSVTKDLSGIGIWPVTDHSSALRFFAALRMTLGRHPLHA